MYEVDYTGFFYEIALTALVSAYSAYLYFQWRGSENRKPWKKTDAAFIIALAAVCVLAVAAGLVAIARKDDAAAAKGFGALSILMGVWLNFKVSRACGK